MDFSKLPCRKKHPEYEDWVIPSVVAVHKDKAVYGYEALSADESARVYDLKRSVLRPGSNIYNYIECAGFLAFVFNEAKKRIQKITGAGSGIRFTFSVCLPVTQMIDSELTDHFREMLSFAECIFSENKWNDWNYMKRRYDNFESSTDLKFTDVIPESVAEVIDLIIRKQSLGLYALYDFGAGTTELTIFRMVSSSYQKGCEHIMDTEIVYKGFSDLDALCKGSPPSDELVKEHYQRIWDEFNKLGIWKRMKDKKIIGDGSLEPFLNMQIYASGGASQHPIVQDIFKTVPLYVGHDYIECKTTVLPEPISWDSTKPPYHRFAVSYGLTQDPKETLENFVLPLDCPKVVRATKIRELTEDQILEANKKWLG